MKRRVLSLAWSLMLVAGFILAMSGLAQANLECGDILGCVAGKSCPGAGAVYDECTLHCETTRLIRCNGSNGGGGGIPWPPAWWWPWLK